MGPPTGNNAFSFAPPLPPHPHPNSLSFVASRVEATATASADHHQPGADSVEAAQINTIFTAPRSAAARAQGQSEILEEADGRGGQGVPQRGGIPHIQDPKDKQQRTPNGLIIFTPNVQIICTKNRHLPTLPRRSSRSRAAHLGLSLLSGAGNQNKPSPKARAFAGPIYTPPVEPLHQLTLLSARQTPSYSTIKTIATPWRHHRLWTSSGHRSTRTGRT